MKTIIGCILFAGCIASFGACSKNDDIDLQAHDENRMMDSMQ